MESFAAKLNEYWVLFNTPCPETEPYKKKYEARDLAEAALKELEQRQRELAGSVAPGPAVEEDSVKARELSVLEDLIAMFQERLGINFIATEENSGEREWQDAAMGAEGLCDGGGRRKRSGGTVEVRAVWNGKHHVELKKRALHSLLHFPSTSA